MVERLIENDGIETALRDVVLYIPRNEGRVFNPAPGPLCDGDIGNTNANIPAEGWFRASTSTIRSMLQALPRVRVPHETRNQHTEIAAEYWSARRTGSP